jgi:hypothetical protein
VIRTAESVKRYESAKARFLKPAIMNFFQRELPRVFGPVLSEKMAQMIIELFDNTCPEINTLKPGQLIWMALDKRTRGDSPNRKFVPVKLDLITPEDVEQLTNGVLTSVVASNAIARLFRQAYEQGGVLSTRDVSIILHRHPSYVSNIRIQYEQANQCVLPHTGVLHDMGSSISHKNIIVRKIISEKKDPAKTAKEVNHSQRAVDRYLKDYHRVNTVYKNNPDPEHISLVTGLSKFLVKQYIEIIKNEN